jgi:hypothetical protein
MVAIPIAWPEGTDLHSTSISQTPTSISKKRICAFFFDVQSRKIAGQPPLARAEI